jgi:Tol biopolymer transport system component
MDADGGNQERLTDNRAYDDYPTWSPDRENIAFVSDRAGGWPQIYVMDARGKRAIKLTDTPGPPTQVRSFSHPIEMATSKSMSWMPMEEIKKT